MLTYYFIVCDNSHMVFYDHISISFNYSRKRVKMNRQFFHYDKFIGSLPIEKNTVVLTKVVEKPKYRYSHVDAEWNKITSDNQSTSVISEDNELDRLFEDLKIAENNSFVTKMAFVYGKNGYLTEKQTEVLKKILRDTVANKVRAKNQGSISVDKIRELFSTPLENGLKYPKFTVGDITLSLPTENSASYNKDAIYVRHEDVYVGKIMDGKFMPTNRCHASVSDKLMAIAKDPRGEAVGHGHLHGNCSMCRKRLSDDRSMKVGYGQTCAKNWGMPWGEK